MMIAIGWTFAVMPRRRFHMSSIERAEALLRLLDLDHAFHASRPTATPTPATWTLSTLRTCHPTRWRSAHQPVRRKGVSGFPHARHRAGLRHSRRNSHQPKSIPGRAPPTETPCQSEYGEPAARLWPLQRPVPGRDGRSLAESQQVPSRSADTG